MAAGILVDGIDGVESSLQAMVDAYFQTVQFVVYASAPYAAFVEYGTSRSPAQPFLRPAVRDATGSFNSIAQSNQGSIQAILSAVVAAIEAAAKRYVPVDTGFLKSTISSEQAA